MQDVTDPLKILEPIQALIPIVLGVGTILSVIIFIYVIASTIHKWRVQSAILRIDKNLQKLVSTEDLKSKVTTLDTPVNNNATP